MVEEVSVGSLDAVLVVSLVFDKVDSAPSLSEEEVMSLDETREVATVASDPVWAVVSIEDSMVIDP